jgi:hypothetical protein
VPTILRIGPFRFFFYSGDRAEPPHVHVEGAGSVAKFWLKPVSSASSSGFRFHELRRLRRLVGRQRWRFLRAWHEHFRA